MLFDQEATLKSAVAAPSSVLWPLLLRLVQHLPSDRCRARVNLLAPAGVGQPLTEADKAARGRRNERNDTGPSAVRLEPTSEFTSRAKAAWARLIRKVCEVDPLECPKCKGPMRIITLIDDLRVIRRILEHLGLRQAGRPADRAAQQVRAGCKPENGEGSRNRDSESLLLRADEVIR